MTNALIGHTGFVGSVLKDMFPIHDTYNSANIGDSAGKSYDRVFCAGAPGTKWKANAEPAKDKENIMALIEALSRIDIRELILISTIDVFDHPAGVNESTPTEKNNGNGANHYGANRRLLEAACMAREGDCVTRIVRLPGLIHRTLSKNPVYDMVHGNELNKLNPDSVFQFYDLENLKEDINRITEHDLRLIHLTSEPVSLREISQQLNVELDCSDGQAPAIYDMQTEYSQKFPFNGAWPNYQYSAEDIFESARRYQRFIGAQKIDG